MSGTWLVIPVKGLEEGKSRLAPVLPTVVRQRLVKAMLADVLAAASAAAGVAGRLLVTPDRRIAAQGEREGAAVLLEPRARGLNRAAGRGISRARALGAAGVVVVPGDVPLTEAHDIEQVVRAIAGGQRRVAIVPSADGLGTNALAETPPGVLAPSFGPNSFQRHRAAALALALDVMVLHLPGLAADVDAPGDLDRLVAARPSTYAFLAPCLQAACEVRRAAPADARHARERSR
jgi:2-phospho-L-lactate guanylyltransferase